MFQESNLTEGETIALQMHPHWSFLAGPLVVLFLALVVAIGVAQSGSDGDAGSGGHPLRNALLIMVIPTIWFVGRYMRWVTTLFVITSHRIIYRHGVFARAGVEIPHEWVNNVNFKQTILGRLVGTGDLLIESAGEDGHSEYDKIRDPRAVQNLIHAQAEAAARRRAGYGQTAAPAPPSTPATPQPPAASPPRPPAASTVIHQLERLEGLLSRGSITQAEFDSAKARLLG